MEADLIDLVDELERRRSLTVESYEELVEGVTPAVARHAARKADACRRRIYGTAVFVRGLIEIGNHCKNNCKYCGIRRGNVSASRFRLSADQILACAEEGYRLGFRTIVLQGGEDPWFDDERVCGIVAGIKEAHPDCAVTLSLGERPRSSYQALRDAGADRYLLRHETATREHYALLHPSEMSFDNRMRCLDDLRDVGFVVGCGFMVGSPFQTSAHLAADLAFVEHFAPEMCGIGPFVPHHATEFAHEPAGSVDLTCFLLSLLRLMHPSLLLPATTALGTLAPDGRERGICAGANVVMPNLSPLATRKKYELYDNKLCSGEESAQALESLRGRMRSIGYEVVVDRGDPRPAV